MERRVIHSQPTRGSLLIGTRIIGVKILIREIAACTRLCCITTATVAATASPQSATGPTQAARAAAETTSEASRSGETRVAVLCDGIRRGDDEEKLTKPTSRTSRVRPYQSKP
jgi:hypothetical protein